MYLEIFLADFAVFRVFLGISRDFAETPEFRGSATARNIRSPVAHLQPNMGSRPELCLTVLCILLLLLLSFDKKKLPIKSSSQYMRRQQMHTQNLHHNLFRDNRRCKAAKKNLNACPQEVTSSPDRVCK